MAGDTTERRTRPAALKPSKTVQFSDKNLLYSPIQWSPQRLDADMSSLPPSPMPAHPTFPPDVVRESDSDDDRASVASERSEPERMPPAPMQSSSGVVPAPPSQAWLPPLVYTPWGSTTELPNNGSAPSTPYMGLTTPVLSSWPSTGWAPPPSPSPPALYIPWQQQPYPTQSQPAPIHLHILLAFSPFAPPAISLNVAQSPHTQLRLTPAYLEPATHPPLSCLLLRCRRLAGVNGADDWSIPVVPLTQPMTRIVSVLDVLRAIYISLRTSVHRAEYETFSVVPNPNKSSTTSGITRPEVDAAYFARCKAIADPHLRRAEERKGVKRVDVLCGHSRFLGLSGPLEMGPGVWELNLAD